MKRFIVTGGYGFIGSNLIRFLLKKKHKVLNIDNLSYAAQKFNLKDINKNYSFKKIDINNSKEVLKRTNEGKKIIMYLFDYINKKPNKFITNKIIKKERGVCDFIAGMTDRYAINLYNSIK